MAVSAAIGPNLSTESKFPCIFPCSQGNLGAPETSSLLTPSSSGESGNSPLPQKFPHLALMLGIANRRRVGDPQVDLKSAIALVPRQRARVARWLVQNELGTTEAYVL